MGHRSSGRNKALLKLSDTVLYVDKCIEHRISDDFRYAGGQREARLAEYRFNMVATVPMDCGSQSPTWHGIDRGSDFKFQARTQPFLENSDLAHLCFHGTDASLDPAITISLRQPSEVPRMPIRVTVPRELAPFV